MRRLALTLAALAFASSAALATNAQISNGAAVIDTLDVQAVGAIISELGEQNVEVSDKGDAKSVTYVDEGQPYLTVVTLCDFKPGKCLALIQLTIVDLGTTVITSDQIVKLAGDNIFLTVFKPEGKGNLIAFARVMMIDGGVTRQNLAVNIENYVDTSRSTIRTLASKLISTGDHAGTPMSAASIQIHPVQADRRTVQAIQSQLLSHYREMLTQRMRR